MKIHENARPPCRPRTIWSMPRVKTDSSYVLAGLDRGSKAFDDALHRALYANAKLKNKQSKPDVLWHGSPFKIKKGGRIDPVGPLFHGDPRRGVNMTSLLSEAKRYAKASDQGGLSKSSHGRMIKPNFFAQKGYVYKVDVKNTRGIFKIVHDANLGGHSNSKHWGSLHSVHISGRKSVRFSGRVPITRNEALVGGGLAVAASAGGYFYYRHRKGKRERVRNSKYHASFHGTHAAISQSSALRRP